MTNVNSEMQSVEIVERLAFKYCNDSKWRGHSNALIFITEFGKTEKLIITNEAPCKACHKISMDHFHVGVVWVWVVGWKYVYIIVLELLKYPSNITFGH